MFECMLFDGKVSCLTVYNYVTAKILGCIMLWVCCYRLELSLFDCKFSKSQPIVTTPSFSLPCK